jgi:hypothetical protein
VAAFMLLTRSLSLDVCRAVLWLCGATTHSAAGLSCCWLCCITLLLLLKVLHQMLLQAHT